MNERFCKSKIITIFAMLFRRRATMDSDRRGGRVIDCSGLENRRTERYRGFESLPLRNLKRKLLDDSNLRFFLQKKVFAY